MSPQARPMAKVNLTLEVVGKRPDGYHELRSVFLRIGLADSLVVTATGMEDTLTTRGLPCPTQGNLVLKAFDLVRDLVDPRLPALSADLYKGIPLGAGLGGGSSDGAAAIDLASAAWGIGLGKSERIELAAALGSDVPFFVAGGQVALIEGRGETVTPLPEIRGGAAILLAVSSAELSTAHVFARFDEMERATDSTGSSDRLKDALDDGMDGAGLARMMGDMAGANDLWPAAISLAPALAERRTSLEQATGWPWALSGSGPTLFCVLPSLAEAVAAGTRLAADRPPELAGVMLCAVDLDNPDNAWREP